MNTEKTTTNNLPTETLLLIADMMLNYQRKEIIAHVMPDGDADKVKEFGFLANVKIHNDGTIEIAHKKRSSRRSVLVFELEHSNLKVQTDGKIRIMSKATPSLDGIVEFVQNYKKDIHKLSHWLTIPENVEILKNAVTMQLNVRNSSLLTSNS